MAARTVRARPEDWSRVAEQVLSRRNRLGLTAAEAVERAGRGLSLAVLSQIENARRDSYALRTVTALCRALGWTDDSVDRILAGGDPIDDVDQLRLAQVPEGERKETLEEAVARLQREVDRLTAIVEAQQQERGRQGERT